MQVTHGNMANPTIGFIITMSCTNNHIYPKAVS